MAGLVIAAGPGPIQSSSADLLYNPIDTIREHPAEQLHPSSSQSHYFESREQHAFIGQPSVEEAADSGSSDDNSKQPSPSSHSFGNKERQPVFRDPFVNRRTLARAHRTRTAPAGKLPRVHSLEMAAAAIENVSIDMAAPCSPPELSSSKSSKSGSDSSSFSLRSSGLSDAVAPENLSHFEDIAINDAKRDSYDLHSQQKRPLARPQPPRALHSMVNARGKGPRAIDTSMMNGNVASRSPKLTGHVGSQPLNMGPGRHPRNGLRHSSSSSILPHTARQRDSRSPSPTKTLMNGGMTRSPSSVPNLSPGSFFGNRQALGRPQSRKSIKELEAEYHDSDEDIPEDAVVWNVPISPFPGTSNNSRAPSPHRRMSQASIRSTASGSPPLDKQSSEPTPHATESNFPPGTSPKHPSLPRSATIASFPADISGPLPIKERTKSWQADLSDDARHLTVALESFWARPSDDGRTPMSSAPSSPPRRSNSFMRSRTSIVELPPVQKTNIMIDPLPISKEKEAVLARTRPSWLPPKCKKEEKKHLKQWEKMMAHSLEADKRRAAKQLDDLDSVRQNKDNVERIWEDHVLPNWSSTIAEPRTRELWWRGVNPKNRGLVWSKAIGNDLSLNDASYAAALKRSQTTSEAVAQMSPDERAKRKEASYTTQIEHDVPLTFPQLRIFTPGSPLAETLTDVLHAYAAYRADVGYVPGTNLIAGLLVLNMSASDAFVALANLLNRPLPLAYLVNDKASIEKWHALVLSTLKYKLPALHGHLFDPVKTAGAMEVGEWLDPLLSSLMTRFLDPDVASRIWDVYVFEGDKVLVRAVVGVLSRLEARLYGSRREVLDILGGGAEEGRDESAWMDIGTEEEIIAAIREAGKMGDRADAGGAAARK